MARQHTTSTVPGSYPPNSPGTPDSGTIVGITLGAVGGFIMMLWLIYQCVNLGNPEIAEESATVSVGTASVLTRRSRHHHHHRARRETVEVRTARPVIIDEPVIVQERRRSVSRGVPPPRIVDEDDEDEVVVIEERSPPRRQRSKRRSSSGRAESVYQDVHIEREIRRSSGGSRRPR
jgi:hypothetical protein